MWKCFLEIGRKNKDRWQILTNILPINRIKSNTLRDNHNLIKIIMNKIPCYNERDSNEHNSHVTIQITHYEQKKWTNCSDSIWSMFVRVHLVWLWQILYMVSHVVPRLSFILSQSYMHVIVPELSSNLCLRTILYHNLPNQCVFGLKLIEISFFF